jgi:DNA-binding CsgD family transcriptional regulator
MKTHYCLTNREIEVIKYIIAGYNKRKISDILSLSYHTINTHYKNIYLKLGIHTSTELLIRVLSNQDELEIPK